VGDAESTWRLLAHWLVMAMRPKGPYPVLELFGEPGAAKSTATQVLRDLIDPNAAPLRSEPRELRDLMIAAENGWIIALDNLSYLRPWLSDVLCRLSTGGGFSTRELYTDTEEVIFSAMRPLIINGVDDVVTHGDLMQRTVLVELLEIEDNRRQTEGTFWQAFQAARPTILGALLDAVAAGIRALPSVSPPKLPRMADFAHWSIAVERGLGWPAGGFVDIYSQNIAIAHEVVLDTSVAHAVRTLVEEVDWCGTVAELLSTLAARVDESTRRAKGWPATARALSGTLRRLAPDLRAVGVQITFLDRTSRGRVVHLASCEVGNTPAPPSSHTSAGGGAGVGVRGDGQIPPLNAPADEVEL
jgi:hypothetical protein